MADQAAAGGPGDAFVFTATWRDYLPIALSNLALTIVTLGIYRFWAKARERRYLWSHTIFIDDRLEWTGTGKEMFVGFLLVAPLIAVPVLFLNFGMQALVLRGYGGTAVLLGLASYLLLLYLFGLARFRALRYRLARSWWHGIRGGSDDSGLAYGWSAVWKPVVGFLALALLVPWSMVRLWNERWSAMSFGPWRFEAGGHAGPLMLRWLVLLFGPILLFVAVGAVAGAVGVAGGFTERNLIGFAVAGLVLLIGVYLLVGLIGLFYYAAYFREMIGGLKLGELRFQFDARSKDWLLLFLGDVALVVGTLGVGICFLGYRHWSFLVRHLGATGEIELASLTQSTTRAPGEAEGFASAFDIGAV